MLPCGVGSVLNFLFPLFGQEKITDLHNTAVLKQDLSSLSCGSFEYIEYIVNYHLCFFAAFSNTIAILEVACAILPTLASVAGKSMVYTELLQCLLSVSHWIFVKLFLFGM